ncbi:MAG: hypothetical protein MJZ66_03095 [Bacteroidales bacterium]|nr:hypothetical protein [Bacteroidales bacterium]
MRKLLTAILAVLIVSQASAQEIASYEVDSTAIYTAMYNPNNYSKAPVKLPQRKVLDCNRINTQINMGAGFGSIGSYEFVAPSISYQATDRLQLQLGMGFVYGSLRLRSFAGETSAENNLRAISNYYQASARYSVSEKCDVYGSLMYWRGNSLDRNPYSRGKDSYMATFGASFSITESLHIGIEVRRAENVSPFYCGGYAPYGWGM